MRDESELESFLREKLSVKDFAEFAQRFGSKEGTLAITMVSIGAQVRSGRYARRLPPGRAYTIHVPYYDRLQAVFPPNQTIYDLAEEHLPADARVEVLDRTKDGVIVRMASCTTEHERKRFAEAVAQKTHFTKK